MRNKALPKLLRAVARSENCDRTNKHDIIFTQAAEELEKLDKIEILLNSVAVSKDAIREIINA